ncbi:sodium-dependent glucose transporter 1A-like [Ptychodera flava]|uniref:sodium-dependent glucose transporter 1A-like n=1 Tax=Ptychodera flava TaxID=63121 RepID=UPI00396A3088
MDDKKDVKDYNKDDVRQQAKTDLLKNSVLGDRDDSCGYTEYQPSHRLPRTLLLYLVSIGMGMYVALIGPSLPDFQWNTGIHIDRIVIIVVLMSAGFAIGSLIGGACFDAFNNDLVMALSLVFFSVVVVALSLCQSLPLLLSLGLASGIADGFLETGAYSICVKIWRRDCHIYVQILQFSFALGATLSPLFASPFLIETGGTNASITTPGLASTVHPKLEDRNQSWWNDTSVDTHYGLQDVYGFGKTEANETFLAPQIGEKSAKNYLSCHNATNQTPSDSQLPSNARQNTTSQLWIPYVIMSCYLIILAIPFTALFLKGTRSLKVTNMTKADSKDRSDRRKSVAYTVALLSLLCAFSALALSSYTLYGMFVYTYAINMNLGFTTKTASYLTSLFWGCFAASRGMSIFEAKFLSPKTMIIIDLVGLAFTTVLLAAFGRTVPEVLWVVSCLFGIFSASLFGCGITWAEQHVKLTGKATSLTLVGSAVTSTTLPVMLGKLFEGNNYSSFAYMMVAMCGLNIVVYVMMQTVTSRCGETYVEQRSEDVDLPSVEDRF